MCNVGEFLNRDNGRVHKECHKRAATTPDAKPSQWYKVKGKMRVRCGQKRFYMTCEMEEMGNRRKPKPVWDDMGDDAPKRWW